VEIELGDHIKVRKTGYTHHGIYVGNGNVIHYSGLSNGFQSGPVCNVSLSVFSNNAEIEKVNYFHKKFNSAEIVERAKSRLGELLYDVHSNNCEHFCCWAITGEHVSKQVEVVEKYAGKVSPKLKKISEITATVQAVRRNDIDAVKSISKKAIITTTETAVLGTVVTTAATIVAAPISGVAVAGYALYKIFKK